MNIDVLPKFIVTCSAWPISPGFPVSDSVRALQQQESILPKPVICKFPYSLYKYYFMTLLLINSKHIPSALFGNFPPKKDVLGI